MQVRPEGLFHMGKHTQTCSVWLRADVFKLIVFTTDGDILSVFLSKLLNPLSLFLFTKILEFNNISCIML